MTMNHKLDWERVAGSGDARAVPFVGVIYPLPAGLWRVHGWLDNL